MTPRRSQRLADKNKPTLRLVKRIKHITEEDRASVGMSRSTACVLNRFLNREDAWNLARRYRVMTSDDVNRAIKSAPRDVKGLWAVLHHPMDGSQRFALDYFDSEEEAREFLKELIDCHCVLMVVRE